VLPIAVLAKVDRRLVNTCWKLSDVFTRRTVCEKYQEGLKETTKKAYVVQLFEAV